MKSYIQERLTETSTLRGVIFIVSGILELDISDKEIFTLIAATQIIVGIIGSCFPDNLTGAKHL